MGDDGSDHHQKQLKHIADLGDFHQRHQEEQCNGQGGQDDKGDKGFKARIRFCYPKRPETRHQHRPYESRSARIPMTLPLVSGPKLPPRKARTATPMEEKKLAIDSELPL